MLPVNCAWLSLHHCRRAGDPQLYVSIYQCFHAVQNLPLSRTVSEFSSRGFPPRFTCCNLPPPDELLTV